MSWDLWRETYFFVSKSCWASHTHTPLKRDGGKERQKYLSTKTNGYWGLATRSWTTLAFISHQTNGGMACLFIPCDPCAFTWWHAWKNGKTTKNAQARSKNQKPFCNAELTLENLEFWSLEQLQKHEHSWTFHMQFARNIYLYSIVWTDIQNNVANL